MKLTQTLQTANLGKRGSRLFTQWVNTANRLIRWFGGKALTREQVLEQPSPYCVLLHVEFDYNWETFLHTTKPTVVRKEDVPRYIDVPTLPPSNDGYKHPVIIQFQGIVAMRVVTILQSEVDECIRTNTWIGASETWDSLRDIMQCECQLKSSVFSQWPAIQEKNINKQLATIQESEYFKTFQTAALCMETIKPLHLTHVAMIQFEFGYSLGEIKRLVHYKVIPVKELLRDMESSGSFPAEMMRMYRNDKLNLSLRQSPKRPIVRTVFFNRNSYTKYAFMFVPETRMYQTPQGMIVGPELAAGLDLKAQECFGKLQSLRLPAVKSPAID